MNIHFGPVEISGPTGGIKECMVFDGPHDIATLHQTPNGYLVAGLYWGSEWTRTDRENLPKVLAQISATALRNPRDCTGICTH